MADRTGYIARQAIRYSVSLFIIVTLLFIIPRMMPGDPFISVLGEEVYYRSPELVAELKAQYGLDRPLPEQYISYLQNLVQGNFGYSFHYSQPVWDVIAYKMGWTFVLLIPSVILGAILGIVLGSVAGWRHGRGMDTAVTSLFLFIYSMPHYWLAMIFVLLFAFYLGLFPLSGITSGGLAGAEKLKDVLWHMALPTFVLTLFGASYNYFIMRGSVLQVLGEGFVLTARAKGLSERDVLFRHVLKNSLLPLVTVIALDFGFMVSGALLVEIVFSWGGMGTLVYDAVLARDYPLLHGSFLVIAVCVLAANFIADALYAVLDPRIRGGKAA
ncbi:MAG: dipeptide transporter permease DppB [Methanosaeta sp. PtaU1.Bin060]|nr:MAG: dipeptide transporter permease DppB [Methanosaeta sp. PtaU1.Bin060]